MNESMQMLTCNDNNDQAANAQQMVTTGEPINEPTCFQTSYTRIFSSIQSTLHNNLDAVLFAKYLYKHQWVEELPSVSSDLILKHRVNFCACLRADQDKESRMQQMYTASLFPGNVHTNFLLPAHTVQPGMPRTCDGCYRKGETSLTICPYYLAHLIVKTAHENNIEPDKLFARILGEQDRAFNLTTNPLPDNIELQYEQSIDSKTAYAAYLMLTGELVQEQSINEHSITYQYLPLDSLERRDNRMIDMIDFWKNTRRMSSTLGLIEGFFAKFSGSTPEFRFRPHEVAAYILWLSWKYQVPAVDIAYHIATHATYEHISLPEDYQINKWLQNINRLAVTKESKNELRAMIQYIVSRKFNAEAPLLPLNFTIATPDIDKAEEIIDIIENATWYCDYFRNHNHTDKKSISCATTSLNEMIDMYTQITPGTLIILKDVSALYEQSTDSNFATAKQERRQLLKLIEQNKQKILTIFVGSEQEIGILKSTYNNLQNITHRHIHMTEINSEEAYRLILQQLSSYMDIDEEGAQKLQHYVQTTYAQAARQGTAYVNETVENVVFNHYKNNIHAKPILSSNDIPYVVPPRSEQDILQTLNHFIGLENVKQEIYKIAQMVKWKIKTGKQHQNTMNMHMVFAGNAGTGKTSVAYLMAEMLHSLGFIRENKLVVCSAKDLIGEYTGQTAPKTAKMCEAAYNGVLFIDEAYHLTPNENSGNYVEECVVELIQQMENNRHRLIVIFAGYPEPMQHFIQHANPGLKSRISKTLVFQDYTTDELVVIFERMVQQEGLTLEDGTRERVIEVCNTAKVLQKNFGNARFVRNLFEHSLVQHAVAMSDVDANDANFMVLHKDCIVAPDK